MLIILLVLVIFSALVIAHEFGHFIVAKRNDIKVFEFGVGFPPKLWGKKWRGTLYTINLLPLGGFVRLEGEENESKSATSFATKPLWAQTKVLLAGVAMNTIIAYVIFVYLAATGLPQILPFKMPRFGPVQPIAAESPRLVLFQVEPGSAAAQAGLITGDDLVSINGTSFKDETELRDFTKGHAGQNVEIVSRRNQAVQTKTVQLGNDSEKGILGVVAMPQAREKYALWAAPIAAVAIMLQTIWLTITAFFGALTTLLFHFRVAETVTGPIGVTAVFGEVVHFGLDYVLVLIASISLSLAVVNALPLPALDGGRLFLLILRRLGVPVSENLETWSHTAGFVALLAFGLIIAVSDVQRFF